MTAPFDPDQDLADAPRVANAPLRPRDAATLILVRRDTPSPCVLMGRRAQGHVRIRATRQHHPHELRPGRRCGEPDRRAVQQVRRIDHVDRCIERGHPGAVGAIGISGPAGRMTLERVAEFATVVREVSRNLSDRLSFNRA